MLRYLITAIFCIVSSAHAAGTLDILQVDGTVISTGIALGLGTTPAGIACDGLSVIVVEDVYLHQVTVQPDSSVSVIQLADLSATVGGLSSVYDIEFDGLNLILSWGGIDCSGGPCTSVLRVTQIDRDGNPLSLLSAWNLAGGIGGPWRLGYDGVRIAGSRSTGSASPSSRGRSVIYDRAANAFVYDQTQRIFYQSIQHIGLAYIAMRNAASSTLVRLNSVFNTEIETYALGTLYQDICIQRDPITQQFTIYAVRA